MEWEERAGARREAVVGLIVGQVRIGQQLIVVSN